MKAVDLAPLPGFILIRDRCRKPRTWRSGRTPRFTEPRTFTFLLAKIYLISRNVALIQQPKTYLAENPTGPVAAQVRETPQIGYRGPPVTCKNFSAIQGNKLQN
jgi:hypothetical protein